MELEMNQIKSPIRSVNRLVYLLNVGWYRLKKIIKFKILNQKIDRNQWTKDNRQNYETYQKLMDWSWEDIKLNAPKYFERLEFTIYRCRGRVLEVGCGIGTMTRWISKSEKVNEVIAVDGFQEAIEKIKGQNLPKVKSLHIKAEDIEFEAKRKFDTVVICELIEHLYPEEEKEMIARLREYVNPKTAYIISTPIGFLDDPYHVRGFSKKQFIKHLRTNYGEPSEVSYASGYSQVAFGFFKEKKGS
jgi:2-polyprenyl-3-methyl-5-hydroxy-6-metoxy-1,4-benzoquinol methylase